MNEMETIQKSIKQLMEIFDATKTAIENGHTNEEILNQVPENWKEKVNTMIASIRQN